MNTSTKSRIQPFSLILTSLYLPPISTHIPTDSRCSGHVTKEKQGLLASVAYIGRQPSTPELDRIEAMEGRYQQPFMKRSVDCERISDLTFGHDT